MFTCEEFVARMVEVWQGFGNVISEPLTKTWAQLGNAFLEQIAQYDDPAQRDVWTIIEAPTGVGKSVGVKVFCAMLSRLDPTVHPGNRIVTRRIKDADGIAEDINKWAREFGYTGLEPYAVSWHSKSEHGLQLEDLDRIPVVVTCHRGLEISFERLSSTGEDSIAQKALGTYMGRPRRGLVIDEAFDLIRASSVDKGAVERIITYLPPKVKDKFQKEVAWLRKTAERSEGMVEDDKIFLGTIRLDGGMVPDLLGLKKAMKSYRFDLAIRHRKDSKLDATLRQVFDETLTSLHTFVSAWTRHTKTHLGTTISTANAMIPEGARGAIVLDASCRPNRQYDLFKKAVMVPVVPRTRTYRNVRLHIPPSGHNVGKNTMAKSERQVKVVAGQLRENLPLLAAGKTGLIITHMALEETLQTVLPVGPDGSSMWSTAHWGNVEGSNEWRDCSVVVLFGLQYLPQEWSSNVLMGFNGPVLIDQLDEYKEVCEQLELGQHVVSVFQAVNRGCCRKVVTAEGDCPPMDIYILLPDGEVGDAVVHGLGTMMPGIQMADDWDYNGEATKKVVRPRKGNVIAEYLLGMQPGKVTVNSLKDRLKVSKMTLMRFIAKFQENAAGGGVVQSLLTAGVSFESGGGRGNPSCFVKG